MIILDSKVNVVLTSCSGSELLYMILTYLLYVLPALSGGGGVKVLCSVHTVVLHIFNFFKFVKPNDKYTNLFFIV